MEDGLREVNLQLADLQTFRTQKCSKFQKSREKKYIFRLQKYNFFRLSNMFSISFSQKSRRLSLRIFSSVVLLNSVCSPMARTWEEVGCSVAPPDSVPGYSRFAR